MVEANPNINKFNNLTKESKAEKTFGGQLFEIIITLDNHSSDETYILPNAHVIEMAIEENLLNWPYKGYITYSNKNEGIERNISDDAWFYRMDARDELNIKVKIVDEDVRANYPPEIWEMDLDFIIYDMEDLPATNIKTKKKRIYFWDKRYQMMMDKKIYWSTVTAQKLKNAAYLKDEERSMLSGEAIKSLLTDAAGYQDAIDEENWDIGISKTMHVSPTENSIVDDLNVILGGHVSEKKNDVAIFKYNNRIDKKWQLIPIHEFFKKAGKTPENPGDWQLEHLFFEDVESDQGNTTPYRAPYNQKDLSFEVDIKIAEYNKISTYEFVDMSGVDNTNALVSKPVYFYCFANKTFGMDYADHEIEKVREDFKEMYTDELLPAGKAQPIFTLNKTKKDQINVKPEFTYSYFDYDVKNDRYADGRNKILYAGLMLNEFIKFRLLGSPHRTVGKFVGIDRRTSNDKYKFDKKICGQWFVTGVKHIWNHNRYVNDLCAVKVHMYDDNGVDEDVE